MTKLNRSNFAITNNHALSSQIKSTSRGEPKECPCIAELLNSHCACQFLDQALLKAELEASPQLLGLADEIAQTRPHLFSSTMVFITSSQRDQLSQQQAIAAKRLIEVTN